MYLQDNRARVLDKLPDLVNPDTCDPKLVVEEKDQAYLTEHINTSSQWLQVLSMFDRDVPRKTARAAGWRIDTEDEIRSRSTCDIANANQRGLPGAVILPYVQNAHDNKLTASMKALVTQPYLTDTSQSPEQRVFFEQLTTVLMDLRQGNQIACYDGQNLRRSIVGVRAEEEAQERTSLPPWAQGLDESVLAVKTKKDDIVQLGTGFTCNVFCSCSCYTFVSVCFCCTIVTLP